MSANGGMEEIRVRVSNLQEEHKHCTVAGLQVIPKPGMGRAKRELNVLFFGDDLQLNGV